MKLDRLKTAHMLGATFDYQQKIIGCRDKFRTVVKPRQAGMTTAFAIETLIDCLIEDDFVACIVSPTKRQSDRMMLYIKKAFNKLRRELGVEIPTSKFTSEHIAFHWGSMIYSLPNNPSGIQGIDCNSGIVDEAGLLGQREGDEIMDALVGSLAAKAGKLTISGKPKGKRGMLWTFWDPARDEYKEFTHFKITWEDRAKQDPVYAREVARHKNILTKTHFDETYNAEFIDEGVLIYPHDLLEKAEEFWSNNKFILMPPQGIPRKKLNRYMGIDFGRKRNLTEIHVLEEFQKDIYRTLTMKSLSKVNFEDQKRYIDDMIKRLKPACVKIDERGMGLALLDYFTRVHGERLVQPLQLTQAKAKEKVVLQLRHAFEDLRLAIPNDHELHEQLHSFQKEYTDHGNVRYFGKVDETDFKDDKVIALVAAFDATQTKPFDYKVC